MKILAVGCSHRTTPVAIRERLAFNKDQLARALDLLTTRPDPPPPPPRRPPPPPPPPPHPTHPATNPRHGPPARSPARRPTGRKPFALLGPVVLVCGIRQRVGGGRCRGIKQIRVNADPRELPMPRWMAAIWAGGILVYLVWMTALLLLPVGVVRASPRGLVWGRSSRGGSVGRHSLSLGTAPYISSRNPVTTVFLSRRVIAAMSSFVA